MTENAAETSPEQSDTSPPETDTTDWKAEARKWEQRAKENGGAAKVAEKARLNAMSEAERAIAEAETRGRTAAATEYGKKLALTKFDALAARRNPDFDTAKALEFVDLTKFLDADGEPDADAITAAVSRLVPEIESQAPSFDGGTRRTVATKGDMNSLIRKAAGHG